MPSRRRPKLRESLIPIGPAIIAVWERAVEVEAAWEAAGGYDRANNPHSQQRAAAHEMLTAALGLRPWQTSPLDAFEADPPTWADRLRCEQWRQAWGLRQAIEQAAKQRAVRPVPARPAAEPVKAPA